MSVSTVLVEVRILSCHQKCMKKRPTLQDARFWRRRRTLASVERQDVRGDPLRGRLVDAGGFPAHRRLSRT